MGSVAHEAALQVLLLDHHAQEVAVDQKLQLFGTAHVEVVNKDNREFAVTSEALDLLLVRFIANQVPRFIRESADIEH